jgi:3-dehydroquinate dehydratase/shikimate dehydrogenase
VNPKICVTVTAPSMAELRAKRDQVAGADLIELRLDGVRDPDAAGALAGRRTPAIVTCRPEWEGGRFAGSEEERLRILQAALDAGAEYVDVEFRADSKALIARSGGARVIVSSHDFDTFPADLPSRASAMRATGAEVVKIAVKAERLADCIRLLELGASMGSGSRVLIAMGARGIASRVLAGRFGSAWTYAGALGDIGQVTPEALANDFRFRAIGQSTHVFGLAGSPVGHSVSPAMHNAAFAAAGLDAVYLPCDAADADDFVAFARGIGLRGASVTIPFKVALRDRITQVDDAARRIGAINTIRVEDDGRWSGRNTDADGFLAPLRARDLRLRGTRASILGAGGSARAVAVALASAGAAVTVHARNPEKAAAVAQVASASVGPLPPARGSWDLLVNCTPVGMHPNADATPIARDLLSGGIVYDLVYNPERTRLLCDAATAGCTTIGGLDMLVAQAEEQFRWWTGERPRPGVMHAAASKRLSGQVVS